MTEKYGKLRIAENAKYHPKVKKRTAYTPELGHQRITKITVMRKKSHFFNKKITFSF